MAIGLLALPIALGVRYFLRRGDHEALPGGYAEMARLSHEYNAARDRGCATKVVERDGQYAIRAECPNDE